MVRFPYGAELMFDDVVAQLEREPLCLDCLAGTLKSRRDDVTEVLTGLRRALRLRARAAVCRPCDSVKMTYAVVDAPDAATSR